MEIITSPILEIAKKLKNEVFIFVLGVFLVLFLLKDSPQVQKYGGGIVVALTIVALIVYLSEKLYLKDKNSASSILSNKVFIIYAHQVEQDKNIKNYLEEEFKKYHIQTFPYLEAGDNPAEIYPAQLKESRHILILFSEQSIQDEFFQELLKLAINPHKNIFKQPPLTIFPVRINYRCELSDVPQRPFDWESSKDNHHLASEFIPKVTGKSVLSIASSIPNGKFLTHASPLPTTAPSPDINIGQSQLVYIKRGQNDDIFVEQLLELGSIITVRGEHQMGMTSLLRYGVDQISEPRHIVWINFKPLTNDPNITLDTLLLKIVQKITYTLQMDPTDIETVWSDPYLPPVAKLNRYFGKLVLQYVAETKKPLLLIFDDVDTVQQYPYSEEFFTAIRGIHEAKGTNPLYKNITIAMAISTNPAFIKNPNTSPFNIGQKIRLRDFNEQEIAQLNQGYGNLLNDEGLLRLKSFLGGHPYLTQTAFHTIQKEHLTWADFRSIAIEEDGPFFSHLQKYLLRLQNDSDLKKAATKVLKGKICPSVKDCQHLVKIGLIRETNDNGKKRYSPRCQLYQEYFSRMIQ